MSKIYLDACIVIYFIEKHFDYAAKIEALINKLGGNDTLCFFRAHQIGMFGYAVADRR